MNPRVLCLITDGFEEIETIVPVDLLRRAGAEVLIASLTASIHVTGRCGVTIHADAPLENQAAEDFDLLFLPGGPGFQAMRADGRPARLAKNFVEADKPVAAICAAPTILADAGLLAGRRFTAHASVAASLSCATDERVVEDGQLITSRGAGTAIEFGLAIVARLFGQEKAAEIARTIMV